MIVLTLIAIALGVPAHFYFGERISFVRHLEAIEELKKKGVLVETFLLAYPAPEVDTWKHRFVRKWIDERAYPATGRVQLDYSVGVAPRLSASEALDLLGRVQCLHEIELTLPKLTTGDVEKIGAIPELETLVLRCESAQEGAAAKIRTWGRIQQFWYRGGLGDAELEEIARLPNLEGVQIDGVALSHAAARSLGQSKSIQVIAFVRTEISADLLGALAAGSQLKGICFHTSRFAPGATEGLSKLKQLQGLEFFEVKGLPDDLCDTLAELEGLKSLRVRGCKSFTSRQVEHLVQCRHLHLLHLSQTTLFADDLAQFNAHPSLEEIEYAGEGDEEAITAFLKSKAERRVRVLNVEDGWRGCDYTLRNGKLVRSLFNEGGK